jgi:tetratricopeptide (TPR) repeat protein
MADLAIWQGSIGATWPCGMKLRHHWVNSYDTSIGKCPTLNHRDGGDLTTASTHRAHFDRETLLWQQNSSLDIICVRCYSLARPDAFSFPSLHPSMLLSRFRQQLSSAEWAERERVPLAAGFAILCVIAQRVDAAVTPDESDVDMARSVVWTLPAGSPMAAALRSLLVAIDADPPAPAAPALMTYAKLLEENGAYAFAADVYQLAAELGRREQGLVLVPAALDRVGYCLRLIGRFREAVRAYRAAIAVAQETGDQIAVLLTSMGLAQVDVNRNRYDSARRQLDQIIATARTRNARHPLSLALHDRGALANHEGDLEGAFLYLDEALQLVIEPARKVRLLNDLGTLLRALGMPEVARDAFECVRADGSQADVRWSATINLLDVAADEARWDEFDDLHDALETARLTPRLQCEFLVTLAEGLAMRGDGLGEHETYSALENVALRFELAEFVETARKGLAGLRPIRQAPRRRELPPRCRPTIEAIQARRVLIDAR